MTDMTVALSTEFGELEASGDIPRIIPECSPAVNIMMEGRKRGRERKFTRNE